MLLKQGLDKSITATSGEAGPPGYSTDKVISSSSHLRYGYCNLAGVSV